MPKAGLELDRVFWNHQLTDSVNTLNAWNAPKSMNHTHWHTHFLRLKNFENKMMDSGFTSKAGNTPRALKISSPKSSETGMRMMRSRLQSSRRKKRHSPAPATSKEPMRKTKDTPSG